MHASESEKLRGSIDNIEGEEKKSYSLVNWSNYFHS